MFVCSQAELPYLGRCGATLSLHEETSSIESVQLTKYNLRLWTAAPGVKKEKKLNDTEQNGMPKINRLK